MKGFIQRQARKVAGAVLLFGATLSALPAHATFTSPIDLTAAAADGVSAVDYSTTKAVGIFIAVFVVGIVIKVFKRVGNK